MIGQAGEAGGYFRRSKGWCNPLFLSLDMEPREFLRVAGRV
jgi:hypothetical protein